MKFKDIVEEIGTITVHTYIPTKKEVLAKKAQKKKKKDSLEKAIFYNEKQAATSTGDVQGIQKGYEPDSYKPRKKKRKKIVRRPKFSNTFTKKI